MANSLYDNLKPAQQAVVEQIVGYFRSQGFNDYAIAGICGNCYAESGFDPKVCQGHGGQTSFNNEYTLNVNTHVISKDDFINKESGYGLFQFTVKSKKEVLYNNATMLTLMDISNINVQCKTVLSALYTQCAYYALNGSGDVTTHDNTQKSYLNNKYIEIAKDISLLPSKVQNQFDLVSPESFISFYTSAFLGTYEIPADPAGSWNTRKSMAIAIYNKFKNIKTTKNNENTYLARLEAPKDTLSTGLYYKSSKNNGINSAVIRDDFTKRSEIKCPVNFDVLPNCVGYAHGRFLEISEAKKTSDFCVTMPVQIWNRARSGGYNYFGETLKTGKEPQVGAVIVWKKNKGDGTQGHVAIVEKIDERDKNGKATKITISESHYLTDDEPVVDYGSWFDTYQITKTDSISDPWPRFSNSWGTFLGFIYHPKYPLGRNYYSGEQGSGTEKTINPEIVYKRIVDYVPETIAKEVLSTNIETVDYKGELQRTKSTNLLSYPTLVESPYISVTIGDYTFGSYDRGKEYTIQTRLGSEFYRQTKLLNKKQTMTDGAVLTKGKDNNIYAETKDGRRLLVINNYGSGKADDNVSHKISYPNFLESLDVIKINGSVNIYTINMVYQIRPGDDPNFLDKILSSESEFRRIKISYGDSASPSFLYKEEEAIITKVDCNVDFSESRITYTLHCTSSAVKVVGNAINWPALSNIKPSDKILEILKNNKDYGLLNVFPAMTINNIRKYGWIATNDRAVRIEAKTGLDPLSYINYLVTCMVSNDSDPNDALKKSSYYMTIIDDIHNGYGGTYFLIKEVRSDSYTLQTANTYEVDVGYPGDIENNHSNLVMSFNINNDNSWALLYNYNEKMSLDNYTYSIDNNGNVISEYSPTITTSTRTNTTNASQKAWWTSMTQYQIKATLVIKGLVRSTLLMTYLRVNALFYGQRHISSGLYIITKQEDKIDKNGYRTILSLTRIAGDLDYIKTEKKLVTATVKKAKVKLVTTTMDVRLSQQWDIILGIIKDQYGNYKNPAELPKEDAENLFNKCLTYLEGLEVNRGSGSNEEVNAVVKNIGDLLFINQGNNTSPYIEAIYKKVGEAESNTLISWYNIGTDTSIAIKYPECASQDWYKAFENAAKSDPMLRLQSTNTSYRLVLEVVDKYDKSIETNFGMFVRAIKDKGSTENKNTASTKFVDLCKTAYNFDCEIRKAVGGNDMTVELGIELSKYADMNSAVYGANGIIPRLENYAKAISNNTNNFTDALKDKFSDGGFGYNYELILVDYGKEWSIKPTSEIINPVEDDG